MANYSPTSMSKLLSCEDDLITLFTHVIKHFDNTILHGHRTPEEQYGLYQQGRTTDGDIVTYKDGYENKSEHNYLPSHAVDAVSYPIDWNDVQQHYYFAGYVKGVADYLYSIGEMEHQLRCGADWNKNMQVGDESFRDLFHFELIM